MDYSLSGLSSGFDWKTFINQIMAVQNAPIDRLNAEKVTNINRQAALVDLDTKLTALGTAAAALGSADLFSGRIASSATANSSWQ
ncbi:MAG: flagellar cap protein FliD N-terminal domain-containing protein, partial [Opitutaceae bacterium]